MKHIITLAVLAVCMIGARAQAQEAAAEKVLVGPLTVENLFDLPNWFGSDFLGYTPDQATIDLLPKYLKDVTIICVLGTWCEDSKREVPHMLRILQSFRDFEPARFLMIGTDKNKVSPGGESARWNITKVPTFIFLKNDEEMGRIEEAPIGTLERDMLGILKGLDPKAPPPPPPVPPPVQPDMHGREVMVPADGTVGPEAGRVKPPNPPSNIPVPPPADMPPTDKK